MKRICLLLCTILFLGIVLSSCSTNSDEKLTEEFHEHLKSYYTFSGTSVFSSDHLSLYDPYIEIEEVEYGTYHVIASMGSRINPANQVLEISLEELKKEMQYFADVTIDFAKAKQMDNDYYLYVDFPTLEFGLQFVYDYEEDVLYIPQKYDLYYQMYSKFQTLEQNEIANTEAGIEWLVLNGFGEIKHKEYESILDLEYPSVFLNDNGEFKSYNLSWCECCR